MSDYDLRAAVRAALAEGKCDTFREYTECVIDRMPASLSVYRSVIYVTLPDYIRDLDRRDAGRLVLPAVPAVATVTSAPPLQRPGQHPSVRVAGRHQVWARSIARHIITPDGLTKKLADATRDEVKHYAGLLNIKGQQTLDTADAFNRLADLMLQQKVTCVRELPPTLGVAALQKVAG